MIVEKSLLVSQSGISAGSSIYPWMRIGHAQYTGDEFQYSSTLLREGSLLKES
jgi:hypothetical protein